MKELWERALDHRAQVVCELTCSSDMSVGEEFAVARARRRLERLSARMAVRSFRKYWALKGRTNNDPSRLLVSYQECKRKAVLA